MKRFTLMACAGLFAAAMACPSQAADIARPAYKAPVYVAPFSWSGFYVGINGGYGWGDSDWSSPITTGHPKPNGGLVGGTLGYNLQTGNWVWGIEGDMDWADIKDTDHTGTGLCGSLGCETDNRWLATVRGRIGYAFDRWMPYFTGGGAFGDVKMSTAAGTSQTDTRAGWTVGGGVEWAFIGNWSAKLEYLYVDLNDSTFTITGIQNGNRFGLIRAGVNYHF